MEGVRLIKVSELQTQTEFKTNNLQLSDFVQGEVGNCGVLASLAALSQRTEFSTDIAPVIDDLNGCRRLHFKMYYEGEPITVTIDDALPIDKNNSLVYARSLRNDSLFLASYFEKVFVKQACYNTYKWSRSAGSHFVFLSFSNNMTGYRAYDVDESKQTVIDYLGYEVDNKSSVVIGIVPALSDDKPENVDSEGHAYVVTDYSTEQKAVKLYNPTCILESIVSKIKLPPSLTTNADPNKGEFWISVDKLEKRELTISSLYSENMYKSVFQFKKKIKPSDFDEDNFISLDVCKFELESASTFLINLFSYTHELDWYDFVVRTDDDERAVVELNFELPNNLETPWGEYSKKGELKTQTNQRFKLQPNNYTFSLEVSPTCENVIDEEVSILMRIGSISECTFEELNCKN